MNPKYIVLVRDAPDGMLGNSIHQPAVVELMFWTVSPASCDAVVPTESISHAYWSSCPFDTRSDEFTTNRTGRLVNATFELEVAVTVIL